MRFTALTIPGAYIVEPEPAADERGWFARTWCAEEFAARGLCSRLAQVSASFNLRTGTLRGMHYQRAPHEETKLVRCVRGAIYDVLIDLRRDSPTYRNWIAEELNEENRRQLYIPPGVAHGFQTLRASSEVLYVISEPHAPSAAAGVRWNDPAFGIAWPAEPTAISARDAQFADFEL
jgi:dTDP-4-dehydrorhamnose 3,5-epimerase